jgi:hypothetical protein
MATETYMTLKRSSEGDLGSNTMGYVLNKKSTHAATMDKMTSLFINVAPATAMSPPLAVDEALQVGLSYASPIASSSAPSHPAVVIPPIRRFPHLNTFV